MERRSLLKLFAGVGALPAAAKALPMQSPGAGMPVPDRRVVQPIVGTPYTQAHFWLSQVHPGLCLTTPFLIDRGGNLHAVRVNRSECDHDFEFRIRAIRPRVPSSGGIVDDDQVSLVLVRQFRVFRGDTRAEFYCAGEALYRGEAIVLDVLKGSVFPTSLSVIVEWQSFKSDEYLRSVESQLAETNVRLNELEREVSWLHFPAR